MSKRTRLLALTIVSSFVLVGSAALFFVEGLRPSIESSARSLPEPVPRSRPAVSQSSLSIARRPRPVA